MKRHPFTFILLMAAIPAMGQASARTFTYDAAGNRISMGAPSSLAQRSAAHGVAEREDGAMSVLSLPDGQVRLSAHVPCEYSAKVYTASGQAVATLAPTTSPASTIDLSSLQPGVYVVDVAIGERHVVQKVARE